LTLYFGNSWVSKNGKLYSMRSLDDVFFQRSIEDRHSATDSADLSVTKGREPNDGIEPGRGALEAFLSPQKVLAQYIAWHSDETIRNESPLQRNERKFAMAYYSCPLQAGNRLHHFFNSIVWAMVTNRTLLYKYLDTETCLYHQEVQTQIWHDPDICTAANRLQDCDKVLQRADWIPAYDEWSPMLAESKSRNLSEIVTVVNYWSTRSYNHAPNWERVRLSRQSNTTFIPDAPKIDEMMEPFVDFPELIGKDSILEFDFQREAILATGSARERAELLFSEGAEFVYGMLFKEIFRLQWDPIDPLSFGVKPYSTSLNFNNFRMFSVALHSRHRRGQAGTDVKKEKNCLEKMLEPLEPFASCQVCLMSDRPKTIELISKWVEDTYNCTVVTFDHSNSAEEGGSWLSEHGPNAGSKFLRELDLCQHFTDGFIGTGGGASSSQMLEEWLEYNRKMSLFPDGNATDVSSQVQKCWV
jgi:hypothetical protein